MQGYIYVMAAAFMWGLLGIFAKFAMAQGVSALEVAFWRAAFGWAFFLIHALIAGKARTHPKDIPALLGFGVVCVTFFYSAYQITIREIGVAMASVLLYTAPAWVALMSWLVLKEKMTRTKMVCVTMTILGVLCISLGPQLMSGATINLNLLGITAGLISGFTYALYYIFGKKFLYRYSTPTIFVYALPFGALLLAPFIHFVHKTPQTWLILLSMALVSTYGAFSMYYAGLKRMDATHASVIATFEPLVAAVLAFLLFGEQFSLLGYLGAGLIISAVFMVILTKPAQPSLITKEVQHVRT